LINHGALHYVDLFDGYIIKNIPVHSSILYMTWVSRNAWNSLTLSPSGKLRGASFKKFENNYLVNGVIQWKDDNWIEYPLDIVPYGLKYISIISISENKILILFSDCLMEWSNSGNELKIIKQGSDVVGEFLAICNSNDGGAWIIGSTGIANLKINPFQWEEYSYPTKKPGLGINNVFVGEDGELFISIDYGEGNETTFKYTNNQLYDLSTSERNILLAWPGEERSTWMYCVNRYENYPSLIQVFPDMHEEFIHQTELLEAHISKVWRDQNHAFWMGQFHSMSRYSLAAWRTPLEVQNLNEYVLEVHEDSHNRLWFLTANYLLW